jgi:phage tail-like protein
MTGKSTLQENSVPQERGPLVVSHCADHSRCYPGEVVSFYTMVDVSGSLPGFTLRVTVPAGLEVSSYRVLRGAKDLMPLLTWSDGANHLNWSVEEEIDAPAQYEFQVEATIAPATQDVVLESRAVASAKVSRILSLRSGQARSVQGEETATIVVKAKAKVLKHLPAIYQQDDLMGRFLMLFESFWVPIEKQIDSLSYYFDPRMTPSAFLPWLASWTDLVLDEQWPEERRRRLLLSAVSLYRKRGTKKGLEDFLRIYTERKAEIIEHRAHNFRLGSRGQLGPGIALGRSNVPHTFTVRLRLPPVPPAEASSPSSGQSETRRQEQLRRRKIESIIEAQKPAQTQYRLHIETETDPDPGTQGTR